MDFRLVSDHSVRHSVILTPRSLLLFDGPARYDWEHRIASVKHDMMGGTKVHRSDRISLTMRRINNE